MNSKSGYGSWIITVPLAATVVAYVMWIYLPGSREIGRLREDIRQKQDYLGMAAGVPLALQISQKQVEETEAYNTAWHEQAPAPEDLSTLYGKLNSLAKTAGTTVTRFDPEPITRYETIRKIPLTVGLEGSFAQIFRFLNGLETLPATIWANSFKLENPNGSGGCISCRVDLVVFAGNPENSDYVNQSQ